MTNSPLLQVTNLTVGTHKPIVNEINFTIDAGETVALVGESGSGKSLTAQAILGLFTSPRMRIHGGSLTFDNKDLIKEAKSIRGNEICYIPQNPLNALNPTLTIEKQLTECLREQKDTKEKAYNMLSLVGIDDPRTRLSAYPHELSGGMRQRVLIAMSLMNNPKLLIADEPTTALDVTVQAQIIELLQRLQKELHLAMLFITHDLGVVAQVADQVAVMKKGQIVEFADVESIFYKPSHQYTKKLIEASLL
jgi:ABC-type dipeptide/oligopeptide/nickel transport system ATPase component